MTEEEYELVPLSPIRRMERRLEKLEKAGTSTDMIKELIEVVKTNQQIVDDVVKINSEMIKRVSELSESVGRVTNKFDEFMSRIEVSGPASQESAASQEKSGELQAKIDKLEKRLNMMTTASPVRRMPLSPLPKPSVIRRPLAPNV